ncbi:MarR family transcriptional regulator [Anaerosalibacter bizertensis]|uniref:MarR family transcriptional regulator n=2 Tax=Anaerosalibacter bizertensis TaxID=932217 RepID=A0A9Q4AAB4_9FIRM|nr:MarR family transcriptional regulator [Anaerosalibacter bizertensis]MCG4564169.1 MarR family transcriptional regulator [Anaerosalibacter bizertensis]
MKEVDKMSFYKEESNIFYIYFQIIKKYKKYMEKSLEEFELTPAEIDVLTFLVNNMDKDITAREISMHRGISKGLVSRAVNLLKDKKLIGTKENFEDGRSVYLKIIDEESKVVKKVKEMNEIFIEQLIKDIDIEDLNLFLKINNRMLNNIKDIGIE